ncbi:hypothetical protein FA95DRAFT_887525 [Auriscalpium vulgare]|uniref:Uncharacterized protein n=1 Tax=Auriscalpium vulgare TaxID=40419 RepID=A0ACB8R8D4_9AGAM|nr:hypothetical protein FA95DRAFT_887525 [Auriscalpium vulgare]
MLGAHAGVLFIITRPTCDRCGAPPAPRRTHRLLSNCHTTAPSPPPSASAHFECNPPSRKAHARRLPPETPRALADASAFLVGGAVTHRAAIARIFPCGRGAARCRQSSAVRYGDSHVASFSRQSLHARATPAAAGSSIRSRVLAGHHITTGLRC